MQETLATSIRNTDNLPRPLPNEPPLLLTRICSAWRTIALNTPELWQAIRVDMSIPTVPPQTIILWGFRAANLPRDIQLDISLNCWATPFLHASLESCERWRDVSLTIPLASFSTLVPSHRHFPLLQTLAVSNRYNYGFDFFEAIELAICDAPLLRRLTISDYRDLFVNTAWEQLTTLKLSVHSRRSAKRAISALRSCPNVSDLHFCLKDIVRPLTAIPPINLPFLRFLRTEGPSILCFLTVPHLEKLRIGGTGFMQDMVQLVFDLRALLDRSACPLQELSFRIPPDLTQNDFTAFLQVVPPSVTDLRLTLHVRGVLKMLRTAFQVPGVLSGLKTLRVKYDSKMRLRYDHDLEETDFDPLLCALRARQEVVEGRAALEAFYFDLDGFSDLPSGVRDILLALGNGGMHVSIE